MLPLTFPPLALADWKETRDTLHKYCQLVGAIREVMFNPLPNSLHTNLLLSKKGFTTSPILKDDSSTDKLFEVILDVQHRRLRIESNYREPLNIALTGQSLNALCDETCSLLTDIGINPPLERPSFLEGVRGQFGSKPVKAYWKAVSSTNRVLKKIKAGLKGETSPIHLHVDVLTLSLTWYCKDFLDIPSLEQLDFGFSTGDEKFPDAYFFISSFPDVRSLGEIIPHKTKYKFTSDTSELILPYAEVFNTKNSEKTLLDFYRCIL
jgi:Family of unknown function (DUF5996)